MNEILTVEGHRAPPSHFVKQLERFDPNLRVVWGLAQAVPFPGWVIERRIPDHMKAKVYGGNKSPNRERFAFQVVTENGKAVAKRIFDMMPSWHPVYQVMDEQGRPITELGEYVIDYLRRNYQRTLLGFPELSEKFHRQDMAEKYDREEKENDQFLTDVSEKVLDHRNEVWPEYFAHGGQPEKVLKGTDYGKRDSRCSQGTAGEIPGSPSGHQASPDPEAA